MFESKKLLVGVVYRPHRLINIVNNTLPTHFSNTINTLLDLFFIDCIDKKLLYDQISCPVFSKHDLILLSFDF